MKILGHSPTLYTGLLFLLNSKKFIYGTFAMGLATTIYFVNLYLITVHPTIAPSYLSLFNTMISFIAGLTSGVIGVHSFMDYATSTSNTIQNVISKTESVNLSDTKNSTNNISTTTSVSKNENIVIPKVSSGTINK